MKYKGILPERKFWIKVFIFIIAGYMLVSEALAGRWAYTPITVLVMLACFFQKEQIISEEGVDIPYILFGRTMHNNWSWDEITTLHVDYKRAKPNVMLHIGKDVVTRSYIMLPSDCKEALKLAAERNPDIYIEDFTEEEKARRMELQKVRSAANKRKK